MTVRQKKNKLRILQNKSFKTFTKQIIEKLLQNKSFKTLLIVR